VQDPTSIEHFWLMQMLGNLGGKFGDKLMLYIFYPPVQKTFTRHCLWCWTMLSFVRRMKLNRSYK